MTKTYVLTVAIAAWLLAAGTSWVLAVPDSSRNAKKKQFIEVEGRPDPGTLYTYRAQIGKSYYFEVTGGTTGTVWGTGIYTDDSSLATAAVHAGVLQPGKTGFVKVTLLKGQAAYQGSTQNGVASHPYGNWTASYRVERVKPNLRVKVGLGKALADPGTLSGYQGQVGKTLLFQVTGTTTGTVWGTGVYTDDSTLASAAVHAGVLRKGQKGIVKVTILAGQAAYQGSNSNGVNSHNYGNWSGSYRVESVKKK